MIIDEFTGRILEGRRWSEGLHQAVEAKEGVAIREENQTLATITLQNYFRLYDKLSGMTGTALTEATEFMKIYEMPVVEIPTNRDMVRDDANDQIYKTKDGKWKAVVDEIAERNENGQPILVGTVSVEVSEMLSGEFKRRGIEHTVLNAKPEHAQREGETVAQAGRLGAVTIATNMAGRGVDIKLGGDPEMMAEGELRKLGVKHDDPNYEEELTALMPRPDGALQGRGREGPRGSAASTSAAPSATSRGGSTTSCAAAPAARAIPAPPASSSPPQDDLVRLFAGDRIYKILDRLGPVDDEGEEYPLEAKMLTRSRSRARRRRSRSRTTSSRKRVLEYDDVMNEQRRVVYRYRREVLEGRDMGDDRARAARAAWSPARSPSTRSPTSSRSGTSAASRASSTPSGRSRSSSASSIAQTSSREQVTEMLTEDALAAYDEREEEFGDELMRALERHILLQIIDVRWKEHLHEMDYLREGIHLRGFAQIDPLVAYKNEGFIMFEALMDSIWEEFARLIFHVDVELQPAEVEEAFGPDDEPSDVQLLRRHRGRAALGARRGARRPPPLAAAAAAATATAPAAGQEGNGSASGGTNPATVVKADAEKIGRNDPCWCGSGKKFKKCHGA